MGVAFCPKCGNRVTASSAAAESAPEHLLMKATQLGFQYEKEKPSVFWSEWTDLVLTSRRLIVLPQGHISKNFGLPKCDTIESIESALTKKSNFQIPISRVVELRNEKGYLKVRSQDQTGQKLNFFGADKRTREYEWNVNDNKWSNPSGLFNHWAHWDVWIQKLNSSLE